MSALSTKYRNINKEDKTMKTNAERNAELRKPIEGLLKYMAERLEDGLNIGEYN